MRGVNLVVCEICGLKNFKVIATEIREGPGIINKCNSCGLIMQDIIQTNEEIEEYYNKEYQKTNSLQIGKEQSPREHFDDRVKTFEHLLNNILPLLRPNMKILEIGCGTGELLFLIKPYVQEVVGIEIHKQYVDFMNDELGIEAYAEDVNKIDFNDRTFDIVLSIMTLDHLPNPAETLHTMKHLLTKDGIIYIEVPNQEEALNYYLPEPNQKRFNTFFWHKAHYFYFTRDTLTRLMEKVGFEPKITCRHEYTIQNFLNWYFTGTPQQSFIEASMKADFFSGDSEFETTMNEMFNEMDSRFHKILNRHFRGDTLCCIARRER